LIAALLTAVFLIPLEGAPLDCAPCHKTIAASFAATAHARASRVANAESILGSFTPPANAYYTRVPGVYFKMECREDGFYQTAYEAGRAHSEKFDLVIGSGRRGQTYLYWRDGALYQLPVSFHTATKRWIDSPGYEEGKVHFGRVIPPQCLACHANRHGTGFTLGIQCATCHGAAERHEQLTRPNGIAVCARCHSGIAAEKPPEPDVHGNQVGLLQASRCFQKSGWMTCTTCHDVHNTQRDAAALASRCAACHQPRACPTAALSANGASRCVECHMPVLPSKLIEVQSYRTHKIGIYRKR